MQPMNASTRAHPMAMHVPRMLLSCTPFGGWVRTSWTWTNCPDAHMNMHTKRCRQSSVQHSCSGQSTNVANYHKRSLNGLVYSQDAVTTNMSCSFDQLYRQYKIPGGWACTESMTHVHGVHDELVEGGVDVKLIDCSVGHRAVEGGEHTGQSSIVSCGQVACLSLQEA